MSEKALYLSKLAPEMIEIVQRRYDCLRTISYLEPIGRRVLSERLKIGERIIRNDVETLRQQELINADAKGMTITSLGERVLKELDSLVRGIKGLDNLEKALSTYLNIKNVIIITGDIDSDPFAKEELGRVAALNLDKIIETVKTIAVTGGNTLAEFANHIVSENIQDLLILPARGGLGEKVEIQANTIAAKIADKLNASYRLLHVPDHMSKSSIEQLVNDPYIAPIINLIKQTEILIHGIGNPLEMAERRKLSLEEVDNITQYDVQGEAFGYFFNKKGDIVYSSPSIGLNINDLGKIKNVIAIAGGKSKALAIKAVTKAGFIDCLITDEGAARSILEIFETK
ncbi:central glycolytic genes regulator [Desulfonispora thiosulfatigenes DSM 11270]|uniref:Central glycolytic genes regulator n=1 Tax=Desulfonispora thiosulfatigenes DSM 11270 TaxID=656914 RepID=A0A1W1UXC9_DESTI|nr:sugar-binding domain-containing protein [Desulfonispora thiosulfatigenes]SMB85431.1 central glycolytic genes regulator [Desulfonispora thiosulfatigenes DSM 11270]